MHEIEEMPLQTVEIAMTDPSHQPLFDEAIEALQNSISPEERRTFRHYADINSMVEDMRAICASNQKEQHKLLSCSKKIALFAHAFAPYFDIVGTMFHVRPDWLGWFWGAFRLIFKVGCDYVLFLEKVCDMFKALAHELPSYPELQDSCKQHLHTQDDRVLLSHLYADLVQFSIALYYMFSRGQQGAKLRHRDLTAEQWKPLDKRFVHLQQRVARHRKWLEATKVAHLANNGLLAQRQKEYFNQLNVRQKTDTDVEAQRMARRIRRIDKVKLWLSNCCAYQDIYERGAKQKHAGSCSWFLEEPKYCRWKNTPFDERIANDTDALQAGWHDRILFVQAEPGFGKTFVSCRVIDDLSAEAGDMNISDEPPTTAFFHFNAAHLYCTHPYDAFRALAVQLVHAHRHDRATLDALGLLMRKSCSQEEASSDDVLSVLSLLLRQHSTFLVVDGIDECSDAKLFLTLIPELCRKSDARVILFGRPDIDIPLEYQKWATDSPHIITPRMEQNVPDIEAYMIENLSRMADQGYFGTNLDRSIFPQVASRSNGLFLWASLLLKYLQSPELAPDERRVSLEQSHLLEGLDSIFRLIVIALDRKKSKEKRIAADTFRWLALSIKRLCIPKLQTALAITISSSRTGEQFLPNLAESIPRLTCNLVEVTNCSVVFAHRSVKEYLKSAECEESEFSLFDEGLAHGHLAARCLSYLVNDVPKRPLRKLQPYIRPADPIMTPSSNMSIRTGSSRDSGYKSMSSASDTDGVTFDIRGLAQALPPFDANMPFLRYAALCWPIHLTRALSDTAARPKPTVQQQSKDPFIHAPWLPALSQFLTDRTAVTTWVEASWRYNLPPNLSRLIPLLNDAKSETPPATVQGRELRWVVHGLRQLSDALNELRDDYGATLKENPSLIWQWNIQAATEPGFWPVWDERSGSVHGAEV